TVVEARGVARGHAAVRAERGLQGGQRLHGGAGSRRFVDGGQAVAVLAAADRYFDQVRLDLAFGVGFGGLLLAAHRVGVGALLGDGGVAVVQVLGGVA